ncbi:MAG: hypothetical protein F6K18_19575 [Okeania sp. SIO2C2]|uniref:hypothetical protein n=1 Tax=Okeania sp. SIO2C2 TaxID=2607787 RepID=UPI0013BB58AC|nr:hypothetical protein [Okeania sp. SIO2C2]NEP88862.1 hypothetical protein [Okeania sp. SIO2C2]
MIFLSYPHWTDAAYVGLSTPDSLNIQNYQPLIIKAMGRGSRQMVKLVEEGDRRQETGDRRQETGGKLLGVRIPSNFEHRVDGGVLNPQRK